MNRRKFLAATGITLLSLSGISCTNTTEYEVTKLEFPADHEEYRGYCLKAIKKCRDKINKKNRLVIAVDLNTIVVDLQKRNKEFGQRWMEHYRQKLEETPDLTVFRKELGEALTPHGVVGHEGFFYTFVAREVGHAISHIGYIKDREGDEDLNNIMAAKFHLDCVLKPERGSFSVY